MANKAANNAKKNARKAAVSKKAAPKKKAAPSKAASRRAPSPVRSRPAASKAAAPVKPAKSAKSTKAAKAALKPATKKSGERLVQKPTSKAATAKKTSQRDLSSAKVAAAAAPIQPLKAKAAAQPKKSSPPKSAVAEPKVTAPLAGAPAPVAPPAPAVETKNDGKKKNSAKPQPVKTKSESSLIKKPLVGQKPRIERPAFSMESLVPSILPKASSTVNGAVVKSSPASQEAKMDFKVNDHIVYPAHGVGRIVGVEKQVIAGITNELFLIDFEQEKMKLRVPTAKAKAVGMRPLSDETMVKKAVDTLKGRARIKRTMWSRRAQEYEAKINSGDIIAVAEVVRDLYRATDQPEQSYSERQLFEAALDRLAREVAAVRKVDLAAAVADLESALQQKKAA